MALASVVSGMEKGVKRLSEVNLLLALLLLAFVLTVGPTGDVPRAVETPAAALFTTTQPSATIPRGPSCASRALSAAAS